MYDSADIGGGLGVLRAGIVSAQYMSAFNVPASAISPVIVLRHDGIVLATQQDFWHRYKIGEKNKVTHPWTGAPLTRSPALLGAGDGLPAGLEAHALDKQLARGVIVLACALAFQDAADQEIDVVVAADDGGVEPDQRTILALGEAKVNETLTVARVRRLERARALGASCAGHQAAADRQQHRPRAAQARRPSFRCGDRGS
ncbi:hypothetical protein [Gemmatimonas sp.]|uniref:hypothetical protein n=1 Tax=Gemmatimonas sp. TaxID=1962908 RepID=UPI003567DD30